MLQRRAFNYHPSIEAIGKAICPQKLFGQFSLLVMLIKTSHLNIATIGYNIIVPYENPLIWLQTRTKQFRIGLLVHELN